MLTSPTLLQPKEGRRWQQLIRIFIVTLSLQQIALCKAQFPADHLRPPPPPSAAHFLPNPQALTHSRPVDYSQRFQAHPIPLHRDVIKSTAAENDQTGLGSRIARWFGFGASPQEQQLIAPSLNNPAYAYPRQQTQTQGQPNDKAKCNLCNKYPWIPMMPMSVQYPPMQQPHKPYLQAQWNPEQAQASRPSPNFLPIAQTPQQTLPKQRAVQFNFPQTYVADNSKTNSYRDEFQVKAPAPALPPSLQPILSANALPPLYNTQPFRTPTTLTPTTFIPFTEQELPTTNIAHFAENIGAHSEIKPDHAVPTQIPTTVAVPGNSDVEIIRSHQLTDFVSAIEYPATFVQSETFDVLPQTQMPINHKPEPTVPPTTVTYQQEQVKPHIKNHLPASQLITDPVSFGTATKNEETTTYSPLKETYTNQYQNQQPVVSTSFYKIDLNPSADNYPSASSHNTHIPWSVQSNEIYTTTEIPTEAPVQTNSFAITDRPNQISPFSPPFAPYIPIKGNDESLNKNSKERGTPKRLLDSPKQHQSNGINGDARPFTRDPSELDYRFGFFSKEKVPSPNTEGTWIPSVTAAPSFSVSSAQPTPTSTYGAIDASGRFAGISPPPSPLPVAPKNVHQIIVPYTSNPHPRPFEPKRELIDSTTANLLRLLKKVEQEQQESKVVVSTAKTTTTPIPKFITKVLASNLRELLRREQTLKNRSSSNNGFDLKKLQQNIDDWTEQEYTSLSHRPSTPTIRGRSKHIPAEYLTATTTPLPQTKVFETTQSFDSTGLSTSINNLENLKSSERDSKRFEYPPIEQNLITDFESSVTQATTTSITLPTTTTTRSSPTRTPEKNAVPLYRRPVTTETPPEVLWQKAKVLISPDTKEKLYVVTPQPRFFPQRFVGTSTPAPFEIHSAYSQKSPRFLVRPTPGNGTSVSARHKPASFSNEPFGLLGLSAFVPAEPVEIIHGNSKVVTTVTPTASTKPETEEENVSSIRKYRRTDYVTINRRTTKTTMSPSPR